MRSAIVIPARYGSTRFPAKPLHLIAGEMMIVRVAHIALKAAEQLGDCEVLIATDDARIKQAIEHLPLRVVMTNPDCPSGSDRVLEAIQELSSKPDFVMNLQGDAPCVPVHYLTDMVNAVREDPSIQVVTPAVALSWEALDQLRVQKITTPFSGTTVCMDAASNALWFSKNIIPAIRQENRTQKQSPVYQHIGLYGYKTACLKQFVALPPGHYEQIEGLEQLRLLENGIPIRIVVVDNPYSFAAIGVDTLEDAHRLEQLLLKEEGLHS